MAQYLLLMPEISIQSLVEAQIWNVEFVQTSHFHIRIGVPTTNSTSSGLVLRKYWLNSFSWRPCQIEMMADNCRGHNSFWFGCLYFLATVGNDIFTGLFTLVFIFTSYLNVMNLSIEIIKLLWNKYFAFCTMKQYMQFSKNNWKNNFSYFVG